MDGHWRITLTGDISVFAAQASALIRSQIKSLALAIILITGLLIVNLRSVRLGLVSLIPKIPPVALIFAIMGWRGISLDSVTVFAASVALGLAVDDTVHFLTQLKLVMRTQRDKG
jgi:predicted RND superfamily exporter protein